jgi:hypothetical protein
MTGPSPTIEIIFGFLFCLIGLIFIKDSWLYLHEKKKFLTFWIKINMKFFELFRGKEAAKRRVDNLLSNKSIRINGIGYLIGGLITGFMGISVLIEGIIRVVGN